VKKSLGAATIALPLPAWVICSYDEQGKPNAMTASWTGICCSVPPCAYFSARKSRYTHGNVVASGAFTVNIPGVSQAPVTDYFGIASGRKVDKISAAGLTAVAAEHVKAPYLEEFPLVLECRLVQQIELGSHTMFIGEIVDVKCEEELLAAGGKLAGAALEPFVYSTADSTYYSVADALGKGYELGTAIKQRGE
jgi:flavin reductase (DIM6/NTAB) family NADH-FMN oxidoreductase RutF